RFFMICAATGLLAAITLAQDGNGNATGRQIASPEQCKQFTDTFLRTLVNGRTYDAFQMIKSVIPDAESDVDATRQTTEQLLDQVRQTFGKPIDVELLDTKTLGSSFIRYDYLLKLERSALHCRAIFYRPRNTWIPVTITFEQDLRQVF